MMKKILNFVSSLAVVTVLASSCGEFLKPESPSTFDAETIYSNYNLAEGAVFGITQAFGVDKSYRNRFLPWYGFNTDIEWYNTFDLNDAGKSAIGVYDCQPSNNQLNESNGCYTLMYTAVERANLTIEGLRDYGKPDENVDMAYLLGEALTLRAMIYYDLCKAWGDVPARFHSVTSETIYMKKSSRDVIFKQLLDDLDEAIQYLPYPGTTAATSRTDRVNKVFAEGLYARIALMASGYAMRPETPEEVGTGAMGAYIRTSDPDLQVSVLYPKALAHLKDAIEHGGCSLDPDLEAYWKRLNAQQNIVFDGETLFVIPFGSARGQWNNYFALRAEQNTRYCTYAQGARGGSAGPLPYFYWKFDDKDVRRDLTCANWKWDKDENELVMAGIQSWYFGKYRFDWTIGPASSADDGVKPVVMRYADILLMAAEIENELNGVTADAKGWLQQVRTRAYGGDEDAAAAFVNTLSSKDAFFNAIVDERAFEFCGEFLRKADLIRWKLLKVKMDEAKQELRALRDRTGAYSFLPEDVYSRFDEATETIQVWGFAPGQDTKPAGNWKKNGNYFGKVSDDKGKDTGLYDARIDGIYSHGEEMIYYMYWPIFNYQISTSQNQLVNDYLYE